MNSETRILEIFEQMDEIIKSSLSDKPKPFDQSRFKKEYNKLKQSYLGAQYEI